MGAPLGGYCWRSDLQAPGREAISTYLGDLRRMCRCTAAFAGVSSHPPADEKYTPAGAAARAKLRSGKALVLNFTRPCPALVKADCEAVWLAWGECQADGQQVRRYTVEKEPVLGGTACEHEDGFAASFPC